MAKPVLEQAMAKPVLEQAMVLPTLEQAMVLPTLEQAMVHPSYRGQWSTRPTVVSGPPVLRCCIAHPSCGAA